VIVYDPDIHELWAAPDDPERALRLDELLLGNPEFLSHVLADDPAAVVPLGGAGGRVLGIDGLFLKLSDDDEGESSIVVVEDRLARSKRSRHHVVGQVLGYAARLAAEPTEEVVQQVEAALRRQPMAEALGRIHAKRDDGIELDEFRATVLAELRSAKEDGRFVLLVCTDEAHPRLVQTIRWLNELLAGEAPRIDVLELKPSFAGDASRVLYLAALLGRWSGDHAEGPEDMWKRVGEQAEALARSQRVQARLLELQREAGAEGLVAATETDAGRVARGRRRRRGRKKLDELVGELAPALREVYEACDELDGFAWRPGSSFLILHATFRGPLADALEERLPKKGGRDSLAVLRLSPRQGVQFAGCRTLEKAELPEVADWYQSQIEGKFGSRPLRWSVEPAEQDPKRIARVLHELRGRLAKGLRKPR